MIALIRTIKSSVNLAVSCKTSDRFRNLTLAADSRDHGMLSCVHTCVCRAYVHDLRGHYTRYVQLGKRRHACLHVYVHAEVFGMRIHARMGTPTVGATSHTNTLSHLPIRARAWPFICMHVSVAAACEHASACVYGCPLSGDSGCVRIHVCECVVQKLWHR